MSPRREVEGNVLTAFFLLAVLCFIVATTTRCASLFLPESTRLQRTMADAEGEIAATDAVYLYGCVWGPSGRDLRPGEAPSQALATASPTPGFVAPPPCRDLYSGRRDAAGHLLEARGVAGTGTNAPELRRKLKVDIRRMKKADRDLRAWK